MASSSSSKVSMKLLIDTKNNRVLYGEATKPVVDFLFNLLYLPIGTVVKLLSANNMVGSLGNLYQSVENLNQNFMQPFQTKGVLLNPTSKRSSTYGLLKLFDDSDDDLSRSDDDLSGSDDDEGAKIYMCPNKCKMKATYDCQTKCPGNRLDHCGHYMDRVVRIIGDRKIAEKETSIRNGFVKDLVTFRVMDDLVIQPTSTESSFTALHKLNVKVMDTLQEKVVQLGTAEGIKLLKASLETKMVLTSVFLKK
ncbi:uncharacterized protein LOC131649081 [Vicia villosa]|uniref:uncharacterized protein LOC131649081 n=1 Tax=Vicia villosa TaxID=3911 RepID=UPI00273CAE3B|nr:uncharacterized protein LOC131649081 [Vicia villosa]